jgi:hypothetical protein
MTHYWIPIQICGRICNFNGCDPISDNAGGITVEQIGTLRMLAAQRLRSHASQAPTFASATTSSTTPEGDDHAKDSKNHKYSPQ